MNLPPMPHIMITYTTAELYLHVLTQSYKLPSLSYLPSLLPFAPVLAVLHTIHHITRVVSFTTVPHTSVCSTMLGAH